MQPPHEAHGHRRNELKNAINADSRLISSRGWLPKLRSQQRRRLLDAFAAFKQCAPEGSVLDVGIMPIPLFDTKEYLSAWSAPRDRSRITSHKVVPPDNPAWHARPAAPPTQSEQSTQSTYRLPYVDGQFDWVFCAETIEHAGDAAQQFALVRELYRVARKGIFVTTSNRRHPLEFNTGLPFAHWLPDAWWKRILTWSGRRGWAAASVLALLDSKALYDFAAQLPGEPEHAVGHKRVFGLKAHFFLMVEKKMPAVRLATSAERKEAASPIG
jgi:hypothetical protein